ncbi:MAG TPA: hypothetical protein V6D48_02950 [Oculatellaceae cyanobacterium]
MYAISPARSTDLQQRDAPSSYRVQSAKELWIIGVLLYRLLFIFFKNQALILD